ncbi:MAG: carboxypeptidase-like regulatory domain-containing protein [Polyangiaceae bacterium]
MRSTHWLSFIAVAGVTWMLGCGDASTPDLGGYDPGSDPGSVSGNGGGGGGSQSGGSSGGGTDGGASGGDAGSTSGGGDAGGGGGTDAGTTAPTDAFSGADPYVATLGASTLKSGHQNSFGTQNPAGHNCLSCHSFSFAGTVYSSGTTPVAKAEVRVLDAMGAARSTYTDANGNFFFSGSNFLAPAMVGVRDGSNTALMVSTISSGACNSCHGASTAAIHLP